MMSRRTLTWTSTLTPATSVGQALQEQSSQETTASLEIGIPVLKVTSRGKLKTRVLTLSKDKLALFCTHYPLQKGQGVVSTITSKLSVPFVSRHGIRGLTSDQCLRDKYVRYIDVADLDGVDVGVIGTLKLESARAENRLKGFDSSLDRKIDQIVTIHHHGNETLDVLVPDPKFRNELVQTIRQLRTIYQQSKLNVCKESLLLRYIWYDVDVNRDGSIAEAEFVNILNRINFHVKQSKQVYRDFLSLQQQQQQPPPPPTGDPRTKSTTKNLTYAQVVTLLQRLKNSQNNVKTVPNQLWDDLFGVNTDRVGVTEFMTKFCHSMQGETTMTRAEVTDLFQTINGMELFPPDAATSASLQDWNPDEELTRSGFEAYLYHEMNDAYNPSTLDPDAEVALDKPLPRYWINTSHNTYLTGDQLTSFSSVQCYIRALRRGCKCLELDVWEGEIASHGEPIPVIYHGHTVTSKILFADVLRAVKNYVDGHPDSYPIILSLENHCSHAYQTVMARMLRGILGDLLYLPNERDTKEELPSPESLRGRVIIKGKRPPDNDDTAVDGGSDDQGDFDPYDILNAPNVPEVDGSPSTMTVSPSSKKDVSATSPAKLPKIDPELAQMTLFHGTKYKEFEKSIDEPRSHMHSISESKIGTILNSSAANTPMWRLYNVHHMTRTYPAGSRVDSSNYNPLLAWSVGCQLVALNFQTSDTPLLLNDGLFRQNCNRGYLLKPPSVLGKAPVLEAVPASPLSGLASSQIDLLDEMMDRFEDLACGEASTRKLLSKMENDAILRAQLEAKERSLKERCRAIKLRIRVLGGSCLPKPRGAKSGETIDPYVMVSVHDVLRGKDAKATYSCASHVTKSVSDNGFCPVWNETTFHDYVVYSPEVALLQFSLYESDVGRDDKVGGAVIPLSCLRSGYRSIQLYDLNNTRTGPYGMACLLVEIKQDVIITGSS